MPLMLELKYEYFPNTWPGRIKLLELVSSRQKLHGYFKQIKITFLEIFFPANIRKILLKIQPLNLTCVCVIVI